MELSKQYMSRLSHANSHYQSFLTKKRDGNSDEGIIRWKIMAHTHTQGDELLFFIGNGNNIQWADSIHVISYICMDATAGIWI